MLLPVAVDTFAIEDAFAEESFCVWPLLCDPWFEADASCDELAVSAFLSVLEFAELLRSEFPLFAALAASFFMEGLLAG